MDISIEFNDKKDPDNDENHFNDGNKGNGKGEEN